MKTTGKRRSAVGLAVPVGASGLELRTLNDLIAFAKLCKDGGAVPDGMNEAAAAVAIQAGLERGLAPLAGLRACLVVNNGITWRGEAVASWIQNSKVCIPGTYAQGTTGQGDAMVGFATAHRVGYPAPARTEFSVAQAKRAGLWNTSGPWTDYPERQLMWRAVGFLGKDVFADLLGAFPIAEEAMDFRQVAPKEPAAGRVSVVVPAAPAAPDALLAMIEEAPVTPDPVPPQVARVVDLIETLNASIKHYGGIPATNSPAEEPGAAEAAEMFESTPEPEFVPDPIEAPAEIPPPAVTAASIPELKRKLEASIAPILARPTPPGCEHPSCPPERRAEAATRGKTLVCTDCGEELPVAPAPTEHQPSTPKRPVRQTRLLS